MNGKLTAYLKLTAKVVLWLMVITIILFIAYKLIFYLLPFVIAYIIASLVEPLIRYLINKKGIKRKVAAPLTLLVFFLTFGTIVTLMVIRLISEIADITQKLPEYYGKIYGSLSSIIDKATKFYLELPKEVTNQIEKLASDFSSSLVNLLNSFFKGILNTAISIPEVLIFIIVTILATYFLVNDREIVYRFVKAQFPSEAFYKVRSLKNDLFSALFGYIRAQLILMTITFTELFTGFSIIGVKNPIILAFIISLIDALPILGTGGILIPWAVISLLTGSYRVGISLLILYLVVLVIRQLIEPKVLSQQIGLHPLVTLLAMYTGLRLLGFVGLILGPVSVLICKNIITGILKGRPLKDALRDFRV